jgi:hypothetical protein
MMLYLVEILPYSMRAKGKSLFWFDTGAARAFDKYVNPRGLKAFGRKFTSFVWLGLRLNLRLFGGSVLRRWGRAWRRWRLLLIDGEQATISKANPIAEIFGEKGFGSVIGTLEHAEKVHWEREVCF